jgi:hypothetical protein
MNLLREEKSYNPPQMIKPTLEANFRTSVGFSAELFSSFHCNIPAQLQQTCTSEFLIIKFLLLCRFCLDEERSKKYHLKSLFLTLYFPPPPLFDRSSYPSFLKKEMHVHILLYKTETATFLWRSLYFAFSFPGDVLAFVGAETERVRAARRVCTGKGRS